MAGLLDMMFGRRKNTAHVAKDRLQLIIAREHAAANAPEFLPRMQQEILDVIAKYVNVDTNPVDISFESKGGYEVLEVNVPLGDEHPPSGALHRHG